MTASRDGLGNVPADDDAAADRVETKTGDDPWERHKEKPFSRETGSVGKKTPPKVIIIDRYIQPTATWDKP